MASDQPSYKIWHFLKEDGLFPNLAKIAARLLSVACNSAAAERIWPNFSFIHTKIRNRLSVKKNHSSRYPVCMVEHAGPSSAVKRTNEEHSFRRRQHLCSLVAEDDYHVFDDDDAFVPMGDTEENITLQQEIGQAAEELAASGAEAAVRDLLIDPSFAAVMHEVFADAEHEVPSVPVHSD